MTVLLAGLCTVDIVQRVEELPAPGQKVQSTSVSVAAGGPATNAAVTVAALGGRAVLLTVLGSHPLAELARADLRECDVAVSDALAWHPDPPPVSAVAVRERDGERTVVSHNAAAVPEATAPRLPPDVEAVLVDGHHPELALAAARWGRRLGRPVVVDAGSWKPVFSELLPLADIVACSAQFRAPAGALRGVPTVITTSGADPVRWSSGGESGEVAVPVVAARDTLGAGDVWHGALLTKVGELGIPRLIEFANAVAAERVRHAGPRSWLGPVKAKMGVI
ncbi:sugar/nucleoside kinase (ribokinase family) [Saccharomonospora amisosensis]|uniref:Sugar/nucleoside kinase (Ribokinase family) n=1 Tax=Saccharomonospora amisosensis TaxID=1128677 RepID=A0A7X5UVM7_9PSEU|nr:PfkB family carbohydrate kinase [Saccharomonospora amisosensis]NIJ14960.1 sugar/nucleoside kinase (ribokinase family) [Saccharomonospora amisosensis]